MLIVYLFGGVAIALLVACCGLAQEGNRQAQTVSVVATYVLVALSSVALAVSFIVMLAGPQVDGGEDAVWWSQGEGQQFLVACFGVLFIAGAAALVRRERYISSAVLTVAAACSFVLWSLLLEAGWSNRGPLAAVVEHFVRHLPAAKALFL